MSTPERGCRVTTEPTRRARRGALRVLRATGLRRDHTSVEPASASPVAGASASLPAGYFVNPIAEGADPYVIRHDGRYLWSQSDGDRGIALSRSDRINSLGERRVVWRAPDDGGCSRQIWAPELHRLDGRWYIYFAASDGRNDRHRAYVLAAESDDPFGPYTVHGPLETGDAVGAPEWAIDMTVLEHAGRRYALWSGWPDRRTRVQHLYIAPLSSPTTLGGLRVVISSPVDYDWERVRPESQVGLNEAPQVLSRDGRTFVLFSCGHALLPSYKLALLELVGDDPLDPRAWRKHPEPLLVGTSDTVGVGHATCLPADGSQWWVAYHAKINRMSNFKRVIHVQPMSWAADGTPVLGTPVRAGVPVRVAADTPIPSSGQSRRWELRDDHGFDYFGHHALVAWTPDGLELGCMPPEPVNMFRSAEKIVARDCDYADVRVTARLRIVVGKRPAGVLLRVTAAAVGVHAQRGYFAGWQSRGRLVLTRTDGSAVHVLGVREVTGVDAGVQTLVAEARGDLLSVYLTAAPDQRLEVRDDRYARGSVGLRIVGPMHAVFAGLEASALSAGS